MANPVSEGIKGARKLRKELDLGPTAPIDPARVARLLGIVIVRKRLADGLSGIHLARASGRSFVAVNATDIDSRQNFTLAHEIAHHIFDGDQVIAEKIDVQDQAPIERRANAFAAELILPEAAVAQWRLACSGTPSPDSLARLALDYHMSYLATIYRLKSCGVIDDATELQNARDQISPTIRNLLNRMRETSFELPDEFLTLADEALGKSLISKRRYRAITNPPEEDAF